MISITGHCCGRETHDCSRIQEIDTTNFIDKNVCLQWMTTPPVFSIRVRVRSCSGGCFWLPRLAGGQAVQFETRFITKELGHYRFDDFVSDTADAFWFVSTDSCEGCDVYASWMSRRAWMCTNENLELTAREEDDEACSWPWIASAWRTGTKRPATLTKGHQPDKNNIRGPNTKRETHQNYIGGSNTNKETHQAWTDF